MGCCSSGNRISLSALDITEVVEAINNTDLRKLSELKSKKIKDKKNHSLIDENFLSLGPMNLSPLGYSLLHERFKSFKHIHSRLGANLESLDLLLDKYQTSIIEYICCKGLMQFLHYYLPIYEKQLGTSNQQESNTSSIDFNQTLVTENTTRSLTPLQIAVEKGHLNIVSFVLDYFSNKTDVMKEFDINYQNELNGENCAMISCRKGNFPMVKYLYEHGKANFFALNKRNENVLVITAAASKIGNGKEYLKVFMYLIEKVKIEFSEVYEDILLLLEDDMIIEYFQTVLEHFGIMEKKSQVEDKFKLVPFRNQNSGNELIEYNVQKSRPKEEENKYSVLSSVKPDESRFSVLFCSVLSYFDKSN
ncbi:hypothetical protein SteCoe_16346 [Stentor coeruleus]|uniref:Uncharacterized protein n=1 Tax=Stentor coeruleus TaxID=5963 RepID=A0A1R2C1H6_9CILI|nr:hypothetical protein SteCoe_16346 [Stentor coeruleus]